VLYLGFLKFLKRDKGKEPKLGLENADDLDIPPPPPDFGNVAEGDGKGLPEFPELPEMPDKDKFPELEEDFSVTQKIPEELPETEDIPTKEPMILDKPSSESKLLSMQDEFPKLKEDIDSTGFTQPSRPLFPRPSPVINEPKPEIDAEPISKPQVTPYERFENDAVMEEKNLLSHRETKGPIYVRIERFRDILTSARTIKNNLKIANQSIVRLNEIDEHRDKVFDRWHNAMSDLQKKLIFVDKNLFKDAKR